MDCFYCVRHTVLKCLILQFSSYSLGLRTGVWSLTAVCVLQQNGRWWTVRGSQTPAPRERPQQKTTLKTQIPARRGRGSPTAQVRDKMLQRSITKRIFLFMRAFLVSIFVYSRWMLEIVCLCMIVLYTRQLCMIRKRNRGEGTELLFRVSTGP